MSDRWDDYASEWDADKDAVRYADMAFNSLIAAIDLVKPDLFDFGCGTGLLTERLSPISNDIVALDSSEKMIEVLQHKNLPNVTTIASLLTEEGIQNTPALQRKFDLVVASSVCSFLPDYEQTLKLIKTLLTQQGVFVQWDWLAPEEGSGFGLTENRIQSALTNAGFNTISIQQPFSLESSKGTMKVVMALAKTN